jgi:transposase-like protein
LAVCPKCGTDNSKPVKAWTGGAMTKSPMEVRRFVCSSCSASYVVWKDSKTGRERSMTKRGKDYPLGLNS